MKVKIKREAQTLQSLWERAMAGYMYLKNAEKAKPMTNFWVIITQNFEDDIDSISMSGVEAVSE